MSVLRQMWNLYIYTNASSEPVINQHRCTQDNDACVVITVLAAIHIMLTWPHRVRRVTHFGNNYDRTHRHFTTAVLIPFLRNLVLGWWPSQSIKSLSEKSPWFGWEHGLILKLFKTVWKRAILCMSILTPFKRMSIFFRYDSVLKLGISCLTLSYIVWHSFW